MARAIIRWSVNGERSNQTGNAVTRLLTNAGFDRTGTASLEADGAPLDHLLVTLREMIDMMEDPPGGGRLDHLWIYVDDRH